MSRFHRMYSIILLVLALSSRFNPCVALFETWNNINNWCPDAKCENTGNCRPCERKWLFVIAQGRSGSTTMKNMINLLPGVRLNGETGDVLSTLRELYSYIDTDENIRKGNNHMNGPWGHNEYNNELSCAAQKFIEALNPPADNETKNNPSDILGFKEIRVNSLEKVKFLISHFPCSRFIFNIRSDEEALAKSQKHAFRGGETMLDNHAIPRLYSIVQQMLGDKRVYAMDMIQWNDETVGVEYFNDLAVWLGFEHCAFPRVLRDNVIVQWRWTTDENRFELDPSCRYVG